LVLGQNFLNFCGSLKDELGGFHVR
jgi:hypothetical protein